MLLVCRSFQRELRSSCCCSLCVFGLLAIPTTRDVSVYYIGAILQLGMLRLVPVRHRWYPGIVVRWRCVFLKFFFWKVLASTCEVVDLCTWNFFFPQPSVSSHFVCSLFFYVPRDGNFTQIVVIENNLRSLLMPPRELIKRFQLHSVRDLGTNAWIIFWMGPPTRSDNCCVNVCPA